MTGQLFDLGRLVAGFWFVAGGLLALVLTSVMRGASVAGGRLLVHLSSVAHAWFRYHQGADPTINVTLNTTRDGVLTIDTWIDERRLSDVWHNAYHVMRLHKMARLTTFDDPLVKFRRRSRGIWTAARPGLSAKQSEYRRTYDRLINLIASDITNQNSLDFSLGRRVDVHRYVVALTYERNCPLRAQHFRVMVVREDELLDFPDEVSFYRPEHSSRFDSLKSVARQYREDYELNPELPERFGILRVFRPSAEVSSTAL